MIVMSVIEALILGIIQGLTEFLPVSSSGHLKLAQYLFGFDRLDELLFFDLVCHLGTLGAILYFFFKPLKIMVKHQPKRLLTVAIGTLPLFPLALFLKPLKQLIDSPQYLGYFFLITAFLLWAGPKIGNRFARKRCEPSPLGALTVGAFQALATLPGVSRSGATISASLGIGLERHQAVFFSFLLAIPATLGGVALLTLESFLSQTAHTAEIGTLQYALGFVTSLAVGVLALRWVERLVASDKFSIFVWYCLLLGLATLTLTNVHHVEEKETEKKELSAFDKPREPAPARSAP